MPATLVLLCQPDDARHLAAILAGANRDLTVVTAADRSQLEAAMAGCSRVDRLVAFRTNCVVPADIDALEMERRLRALRSVGHEGIRPCLTLHGHRFVLEED